MKTVSLVAKILFVIIFPALLLTASIAIAFNSQWLYQYGFDKYNISESTGLEQAELDKAAKGLISYFNSQEEYIDIAVTKDSKTFELFNEREVIHLRDVKALFWLDYWFLLGTSLYALFYMVFSLFLKKDWRKLAWGVGGGSSLTLAIMLLLGLGIALNFNRLFHLFHIISFSNEFWMLDPASDYLIMLFPQGFWFDATLFSALLTIALAVVLGGVAGGFLIAKRHRV